jgi:WXG100 family type VII secretion target
MKIQVDYNEIEATANRLQNQKQTLEQSIELLMQQMRSIESIWQGEDSSAFIGQLDTLYPKLVQMSESIGQYASILHASSSAYSALQQNRAASARLL